MALLKMVRLETTMKTLRREMRARTNVATKVEVVEMETR
jgi:hypothetical protein